jgi:hypothetical protein
METTPEKIAQHSGTPSTTRGFERKPEPDFWAEYERGAQWQPTGQWPEEPRERIHHCEMCGYMATKTNPAVLHLAEQVLILRAMVAAMTIEAERHEKLIEHYQIILGVK